MRCLALLFALVACTLADTEDFGRKVYAHFWAAGTSDSQPDALVTVDWTRGSSHYGQVLSTAPITAASSRKLTGNAPHHIGITANEKWIIGGGLLSFFVHVPIGDLNGGNKDDTFLFSVNSDTMIPSFHSSYDLPGGCTDEFHRDTSNSWIISQMCDDAGNAPGGLYRFVAPACSGFNNGVPSCFASWNTWTTGKNTAGAAVTMTGYNPHGGEFDESHGFIISDFVWPASLLNSYTKGYLATIGDNVSPLTFRGTVNYFDTNGNLKTTFHTPQAPFTYSGNLGSFTINIDIGLMAAKFFPFTFGRYAFVSGTFLNYNLFLIDLQCTGTTGCVTPVFDWAANFPGVVLSVGIPVINGFQRAILQTVGMKHLGLIGYSLGPGLRPQNFVKRAGIDFGTVSDGATPQFPTGGSPGSHYLVVDDDLFSPPRALVINSFVDFPVNPGYICGDLLACPTTDQAPGFMYNFHGARTVAAVNLDNSWSTLTLDTTFNINLGGRTPHSVTLTDKWDFF